MVDNSGIKITAINPLNNVVLSNSGLNNGTADTQGNVGAAIGAGFHFD